MKTKKEILESIKENQDALDEYEGFDYESHDQYIFQGWIEALEWVLDE